MIDIILFLLLTTLISATELFPDIVRRLAGRDYINAVFMNAMKE